MWCIVNLPNGTQQAVKWDPKAIGQECLEKVNIQYIYIYLDLIPLFKPAGNAIICKQKQCKQ